MKTLNQSLKNVILFILGGVIVCGVFFFLRMQQFEEENANRIHLLRSIVKAELSLAELYKGNCELAIKNKWKSDAIEKAFTVDCDTSFLYIDATQLAALNTEVIKSFEEFYYVHTMCNAWRHRTIAMIYARSDSITIDHALIGYSNDLDLLIKKSTMLLEVLQRHYSKQI